MSHTHHRDLLVSASSVSSKCGGSRAKTKAKPCIVNHVPVAPTITPLFERCPSRPEPELPACCPAKVDVPVPTIVVCMRELCRFDCDKTIALLLRVCTPCPIDCFQVLSDWSATFRLDDKPLLPERGDFTIHSLPLCDNACEFDGHSSVPAKRTLLDNQTLPRGDYVLTISITVDEVAEVDYVAGALTGFIDGQEVQVGFHVDLCSNATNADHCQSGKCLWPKRQPQTRKKDPVHQKEVVVNTEQHVHQQGFGGEAYATASAKQRQKQHQGQRHGQGQRQSSKFQKAKAYYGPPQLYGYGHKPTTGEKKAKKGCVSCH